MGSKNQKCTWATTKKGKRGVLGGYGIDCTTQAVHADDGTIEEWELGAKIGSSYDGPIYTAYRKIRTIVQGDTSKYEYDLS